MLPDARPYAHSGQQYGQQQQRGADAPDYAGYALLNSVRFEPFIRQQDADELLTSLDQKKTETSFLNSVYYLAHVYGLDAEELIQPGPYPIWITNTHKAVVEAMADPHPTVTVTITDEHDVLQLTTYTAATFSTGTCLLWIPLEALDRLRRAGDPRAPLLTTIYQYLNRIAHVPAPVEGDGSFMYGEYNLVRELNEENAPDLPTMGDDGQPLDAEPAESNGDYSEENELYYENLAEINSLLDCCEAMVKTFHNPARLATFARQIDRYSRQHVDTVEDSVFLDLALKFHELYQTYPTHSLTERTHPYLPVVENEEELYDSIDATMYTSFVWTQNDVGAEMAHETINNKFNNGGSTCDPLHIVCFDRFYPTLPAPDLHFENTLFDLINDLLVYIFNHIYSDEPTENGDQPD